MGELVLVDVGLGNLRSVEKALGAAAREAGLQLELTRSGDPDVVRRARRVVMPGQGGFRDCARALEKGLDQALLELLARGTPYLGICLGLQILFEGSEEAPGARGLGWFRGSVRRLSGGGAIKIPHMGWNQLRVHAPAHPLLANAGGEGSWVYFVHSYHAVPVDPTLVAAHVDYGENQVTAAVAREHVFATQFHPEKSQRAGLALLAGFLQGETWS